MTAILLIQPASYLQYGRAAYPANLSLGSGDSQGDFDFHPISRCRFSFGPKLPTVSTSVPNSCNLVSPRKSQLNLAKA